MDDLEELRYPWDNALQFFSDGYARELSALHLALGWLFVLWLILRSLRTRQVPLSFRLASIYFALTVFTNPAYSLIGLNLNEFFGVIAAVSLLIDRHVPRISTASPVVAGLFIVFTVGLLHMVLTQLIYPELTSEPGASFTKFAINAKISVLAINLLIVGSTLRRGHGLDLLVRSCVAAGTAGLCLYMVQLVLLLTGTVPYGTYIDAGFVGVPSFGSVSVERGHFGKFMAAYYSFFLFALLAWRWRLRFYLLALVTLINFSASSQVFFLIFSMISLWQFRSRLSGWTAIATAAVVSGTVIALMIAYWDVFAGVGLKVYELAIQGDESSSGGRSFGTFMQYISTYPFGLGYSGSTLRTAPALPEINAAHFAFFTQYSLLGVPILVAYLTIVWRTWRKAQRETLLLAAMSVGALMSLVIFGTDILWFVPLVWLPFEIVWSQRSRTSAISSRIGPALPRREFGPNPQIGLAAD